ncbi:MAG: hypothetical protein V7668_09755 [Cereibacter changlensis]
MTLPVTPLKRLAMTLAAAATALAAMTAAAVPARADTEDVAKALAAVAAVAIIANQVQKNRADKDDRKEQLVDNRWNNDRWDNRWNDDRRDNRRPPRHETRSPLVPPVCAFQLDDNRRGGPVLYPERCLRDQGFRYKLPRSCVREVRNRGRMERFYPARCLAEAGFRLRPGREDHRRGDDRWRYGS